MEIVSGIGVVVSLVVLAVLLFWRVSPMLAGPAAVLIVCLTSRLPVLDALTETYLNGVADFFVSFFPVFLLGNIFGNIYSMSGAAERIGQMIVKRFKAAHPSHCMLACLLCAAALSYGGINSFVIIFAVYPIGLELFREADLPIRLMPGILCGGMWTFAMTGPFTPQIPNLLSMEHLGTSSYAGLIPGIAASVVMMILIVAYMTYEAKKCRARGEHFEQTESRSEKKELPGYFAGIVPMLLVVLGFNLTDWGIVVWLLIGIAASLFLQFPHLDKKALCEMLNKSASDAVIVNMNTAAIVGFGSVTGITPFYKILVSILSGTHANPYVTAVVSSNICACILGSSSGGLALMYTSLKDVFLQSVSGGYNLGYIHRLCALGAGCLDSMPWNGSIVSVFVICHTTHKEAYRYNLVTCALIPLLCTVVIALPLCILLT